MKLYYHIFSKLFVSFLNYTLKLFYHLVPYTNESGLSDVFINAKGPKGSIEWYYCLDYFCEYSKSSQNV